MIHTAKQLKDKVKNMSGGNSEVAQAIIRTYFMERFLERVSVSEYRNNFILKGGMLVASIVGVDMRATMDIDTTVKALPLNEKDARAIIERIGKLQLEDGVKFKITSVKEIMEEFDYPGIRMMIEANLERIRQPFKIDISTDDAITPGAVEYKYKLMFEDRSISVLSYNLETLLAEKMQTILARGLANTRMRDFYDVYEIMNSKADQISFDVLKKAFAATCMKRETSFGEEEVRETLDKIKDDSGLEEMWNPSQDVASSIGNLIALPLQGQALKNGNSAFVDENWNAYPDQWDALFNKTRKLGIEDVEQCMAKWQGELAEVRGTLTNIERNVRPKPWKKKCEFCKSDVVGKLHMVLGNGVYVDTLNLMPRIQNQIRSLAAFDNPEFYKNKRLGYSNYYNFSAVYLGKDIDGYIQIPRGLRENIIQECEKAGISVDVSDQRETGQPIRVSFKGDLRMQQELAAEKLLSHSDGVLSAATAFGKTVVCSYLIAERKVNTLILLQSKDLLNQWVDELNHFLEIREEPPEYETKTGRKKKRNSVIGVLHGNKNTLTGIIDVAMVGSMYSRGKFNERINSYGMVIMDECHHAASNTSMELLQKVNAKYVYGVSATPKRGDSLDRVIYMLLGPVSFEGRLEQYVGRLNRDYVGKEAVYVYDYIDSHVRYFDKMYAKRLRTYRKMGFSIWTQELQPKQLVNAIFDSVNYTEKFEQDIVESEKMVVISSPDIRQDKIDRFLLLIKKRQEVGVKVTVITTDPEDITYGKSDVCYELIRTMQLVGINVITRTEVEECFAVIDDEIVWHGGMNLLGKADVWDNLMRIRNSQVATELLEIALGCSEERRKSE